MISSNSEASDPGEPHFDYVLTPEFLTAQVWAQLSTELSKDKLSQGHALAALARYRSKFWF